MTWKSRYYEEAVQARAEEIAAAKATLAAKHNARLGLVSVPATGVPATHGREVPAPGR